MKLEIELNEDELQLLYYAMQEKRNEEENRELYLKDLSKKCEHYKKQINEGFDDCYKNQKFYSSMMRLFRSYIKED